MNVELWYKYQLSRYYETWVFNMLNYSFILFQDQTHTYSGGLDNTLKAFDINTNTGKYTTKYDYVKIRM